VFVGGPAKYTRPAGYLPVESRGRLYLGNWKYYESPVSVVVNRRLSRMAVPSY